ncbi:MAG TPA: arginine--tRNA ligase [Candidatus Saccharimonadales bacterium]|nr:arginine--tRNA ligase [Candidatus Saccharimonadales bacterium]
MQEISSALKQAAKSVYETDIEPEISRPEAKFGDFSSNIALKLAAQLKKPPREIAQALANALSQNPNLAKVELAGPGFINFWLTDKVLAESAQAATRPAQALAGQEILVEFGDPNPFKEMHIGHLYSYIVGDAIARLLESAGASVRRLSYHGDVGLHVAKTIWALKQASGAAEFQLADGLAADTMIGNYYAKGAEAYEQSPSAKDEITKINHLIYSGQDPDIKNIYEQGRELSFKAFDNILKLLDISNDRRYLESQTAEVGKEMVQKNIGPVFEESDGAVIYPGEKAGLHTRVFITSQGLPTYEAKDLGLTSLKDKDYPGARRSLIITASEQSEYFKVMLAALAEINRSLAEKTTHLAHGFLSLSTGKMSSRTGNVYSATNLLAKVKERVYAQYPDSAQKDEIYLGAVKYGLLRHHLGSDIVYDVEESVAVEGNSGPYLQYAHARACSILAKASELPAEPAAIESYEPPERLLARKISEFPEVVAGATAELAPNQICNYLYELAQSFNKFYETSRIIGDPRAGLRLKLVESYSQVLAGGLKLLGISAPERM